MAPPKPIRRALLVLAGLASLAITKGAFAQSQARERASLGEFLTRAGATLQPWQSLFVERGHHRLLGPPSSLKTHCIGTAFIAPRRNRFQLQLDAKPATARRVLPAQVRTSRPDLRSQGGMLMVQECGVNKAALERVLLKLNSPRSAVDVLWFGSKSAIRPLSPPDPERDVANDVRPVDPGRAPLAESFEQRWKRAQSEVTRSHPSYTERRQKRASVHGNGRLPLRMVPGCHHIVAIAKQRKGETPIDLDAELREASNQTLIQKDRSDAASASLRFCLAKATTAYLVFGGLPARGGIWVVRGRKPLPINLPAYLGTQALRSASEQLSRRHLKAKREEFAGAKAGGEGSTQLGLEVLPSRCYLAIVGAARGEGRAFRLRTRVGLKNFGDDGGGNQRGAMLSFCTGRQESITMQVDAKGQQLSWVLSLWDRGPARRSTGGATP